MLNIYGNDVFWRSKKQSIVTLSSYKSEYVALANCMRELKFLRNLLHKAFDYEVKPNEDNQSCIYSAKIWETRRSKHIDI